MQKIYGTWCHYSVDVIGGCKPVNTASSYPTNTLGRNIAEKEKGIGYISENAAGGFQIFPGDSR